MDYGNLANADSLRSYEHYFGVDPCVFYEVIFICMVIWKQLFFKEKFWPFHGLLLFFLDFAYESDCMKPFQNHCILIMISFRSKLG